MAGDLHRCMFYKGSRIWTWCGRQLQYMPLAPGGDGKVYGGNLDGWIEIEGGVKSHAHEQSATAKLWDITHSLGTRYPKVLLLNQEGREFKGYIAYETSTENYIQVRLAIPTSGTAIVTNG